MNQAAVCEIPLQSGRLCGVTALGRCMTCERAFCRTHQAIEWYNYGSAPYVDMCAPCLAETPEKVAAAVEAKRRAEAWEAEQYFARGSAQTAFLNSGVPPVEIYITSPIWKNGLFGLGGRIVDKVIFIRRGWILGQFEWKYNDGEYREGTIIVGDYLTALLNVSLDDQVANEREIFYTHGLIRAQPYSGGFGGSSSGYRWVDYRGDRFKGNWITAVQVVKRLTGESS